MATVPLAPAPEQPPAAPPPARFSHRRHTVAKPGLGQYDWDVVLPVLNALAPTEQPLRWDVRYGAGPNCHVDVYIQHTDWQPPAEQAPEAANDSQP